MTAQFLNTATVNFFETTLDGNITDVATSIILTSVTGLQSPGILLLEGDRGSVYREFISYTDISVKTLTGVTRGLGGSTGKVHNTLSQVQETLTVNQWNDLIESLSIEHQSSGAHKVFRILHTLNSYTPSAAATATLNLTNGSLHLITMPAGNITIAISNASIGQYFVVRILQDGVGSRTVTWFDTISWDGGTVPTLTTTANKVDVFGFVVTGSGTYNGYTLGQNL